ncbi:MAG TPA: tetratricopeptide repeat protein [Ignavibacteria bacterium]|nr:tetratricopeptide repeat protein [Ignavibacteria bacterium]
MLISGQFYLKNSDANKAILSFKYAENILDKFDDDLLKSKIYHYYALSYYEISNFKQSLEKNIKALKLRTKINDELGMAQSYNNIGLIYSNLGNLDVSVDYYSKSLALKEKLNDENGILNSLGNIAAIYYYLKNYDLSIMYGNKIIDIARKTDNKKLLSKTLSNLSASFGAKGNYEKTKELIEEAMKIDIEIGDMFMFLIAKSNYADLYYNLGDYERAEKEALECYNGSKDINALKTLAYSTTILARIKFKQKDFNESIKYHLQSIDFEKELGFENEMVNSLALLSDVYFEIGDKENSLKYLRLYRDLNEKIKQDDRQQKADSILIQFEVEKNTKEFDVLNQKNIKLTELTEKLNEVVKETNDFVSFLSHDLREPLANIYSISDYTINDFKNLSNEELMSYLSDIRITSTKAISILESLLRVKSIESESSAAEKELVNVIEMIDEIISKFRHRLVDKNIQLSFNYSENISIFTIKQYLEQIIINLISNAIKYSQINSKVSVNVEKTANEIFIKVKDSGPGIKKEEEDKLFKKFVRLSASPTMGESTTGLGLYLVKILSGKINAEISFVNNDDIGATFILKLNL